MCYGKMESIKKILGLLLSEVLEFRVEALKQEELIEKYTIAQTISSTIFDLLCYETKELRTFIENKSKEEE